MTSPTAPAHADDLRVAFYGRVAREDDPQPALKRQLCAVTAALPSQTPIVGHFVDVGPWNGLRGSKYATSPSPNLGGHPVDGGLVDLLDRTLRPDRHFDVVACACADRLSRRLIEYVRIEDDLAAHGVRVVTADDPTIATLLRPVDTHDITQKRLRRWAWDMVATETAHHSRAVRTQLRAGGWHLGPTPYGYITETLTVARRLRRRLVVDPVCALTVRTIFAYRVHEGRSVAAIARALNANPDQPSANRPGKTNSAVRPWSAAAVRAILANPVYTGYLVRNRVDTNRRIRPIDQWRWSPAPVHEPIIALDIFLAAQTIATVRQSSADDHGDHSAGEPTTRQQPPRGDRL